MTACELLQQRSGCPLIRYLGSHWETYHPFLPLRRMPNTVTSRNDIQKPLVWPSHEGKSRKIEITTSVSPHCSKHRHVYKEIPVHQTVVNCDLTLAQSSEPMHSAKLSVSQLALFML